MSKDSWDGNRDDGQWDARSSALSHPGTARLERAHVPDVPEHGEDVRFYAHARLYCARAGGDRRHIVAM